MLSAVIFIPVLLLAIWLGDPWYTIVLAVAAALGALEFFGMVGDRLWRPLIAFGALWSVFFVLNAHSTSADTTPILMGSAVILSLLITLRAPAENAFVGWAWLVSGIFYVGLLAFWVPLMGFGREWVLLALFSTFAFDTTAYFVGRTWGRHKMTPVLSPGKTWEGFAGGAAGAMAASVVLAALLGLWDLGYGKLALLGLLIAVFGQLGDLCESKLKRSTGIKDAGKIIPGHGGILDRLDSILFTGIVVYYYLRWLL